MIRLSILAVALIAQPAFSAQPSCEISAFGILASQAQRGVRKAPTTVTGKVRDYEGISIQEHTDRIPARLGLRFGVQHKFQNIPAGELKVVITHPPIASLQGSKLTVSSANIDPSDLGTNYGFDTPSELVPGTWTFEFRHHDRLLCRKAFTVVLP